MTSSFAELGLSAKVLAAIEAAGYPSPTPIQAQAIPVATTGRDVLGIAQTGTGKTASFVLPMITRLESGRARARMPRSLILAPTRELAAQVAQSFEKYGVNHKLSVALLIGGVSMDDQLQKLDRGVDVLIATPGRLLDHFGRGKLMLMGVEILVIDEADRMLDMGFIPDIEKICKLLPPKRQTLFFSATMPPEITRLVDQFLKDPARIEVARPATTAKTITQRFSYCPSSEDWAKREVLRELIRSLDVKNAIIFCNRKRDVAILLKSLTKHGFNAGALHGDMDQMSRMATLDKFRSGEITLLAASDVAARGLDIPDVSHVFNFDVPWQPDDYVHRIGRTGRAGKEGFSATIVTPEDVKSMEAIAKLIGEETVWLGEIPDEATLAEGRMKKRGRGGRGGRPGGDQRGGRGRSDMRHGAKFGGGGRGDRPERRPRPERQERPERIHEPRGEHRVDHLDAPPAPSSRPQFGRPVQERAEGRSERFDRADRPERSRRRDEETGHRDDQGRDRPSHISHGDRGWDETRDAPRRDRERDHDARDDRGYEPRTRARHRDESRTSEPRPAAPRDRFERDEPRYREHRPGRSERDSRDGHSASRGGDHRDARRDRPAREEPAEHRDRPHRRDRERTGPPHGDRGHEEPPRPQQHRDRSPPQRDRAGRERDNGGQGTGLGEHVPAFLRRPVRANAD